MIESGKQFKEYEYQIIQLQQNQIEQAEEKEAIKFNLKQVEDSYELHTHNSLRKSIKEALNLIEKLDNTIKGNKCAIETLSHNGEVLLEAIKKQDKRINELEEVAEYWRKEFDRIEYFEKEEE